MNCKNGHSALDTMKFCSVCGVALTQPTEPTGQPVQNNSGYASNPPQLPEKTKKKSNKFAVTVILFIFLLPGYQMLVIAQPVIPAAQPVL
jgi:hypothetical protein